MNPYVLTLGYALIALQYLDAARTGFLTRGKMEKRHGPRADGGYSISEHGGVTADEFLITPLCAWIVERHRFDYASLQSLIILTASAVVVFVAGGVYKRASYKTPEAHAQWGATMFAGRMHGLYALLALWVIALFYIAPAEPAVSRGETIAVSCLLTPFFFVGAAKWSFRWLSGCWKRPDALVPALGGPTLVWIVAYLKLAHMH